MSHIYQIAFLDTQETQWLEFFFKALQRGITTVMVKISAEHIDMNRVFFGFKVKNIIDCQIDDLTVILNGNDLSLGCKMLHRL